MYTDMIQENIGMSAQSLKDRVVRNEKTIQTGYYDKYILCQQCENEMLGGSRHWCKCYISWGRCTNGSRERG